MSELDNIKMNLNILRGDSFVPNTFGKVISINQSLAKINVNILSESEKKELKDVCKFLAENPLVFGIPEKWLINQVIEKASAIRKTLETP